MVSSVVIHVPTIKPFDVRSLSKLLKNKVEKIITIEEHIDTGGLGSIIINHLNELNFLKIKVIKYVYQISLITNMVHMMN